MQALATLVLVVLTGYYAWASRALVRETRTTLQATARATLQARMDRISEILIREPGLFSHLDDLDASGDEEDERFHIANMFLSIIEEAHTQYAIEHSMPTDDWTAWEATANAFLKRHYIAVYWARVHHTFEPSFRRFIDSRLTDLRQLQTAKP
jgi:hypothetical protein